MNFAFATGTDIDADGVLSVNGKLTLFVENWETSDAQPGLA